jgi:hypothetical protein
MDEGPAPSPASVGADSFGPSMKPSPTGMRRRLGLSFPITEFMDGPNQSGQDGVMAGELHAARCGGGRRWPDLLEPSCRTACQGRSGTRRGVGGPGSRLSGPPTRACGRDDGGEWKVCWPPPSPSWPGLSGPPIRAGVAEHVRGGRGVDALLSPAQGEGRLGDACGGARARRARGCAERDAGGVGAGPLPTLSLSELRSGGEAA